MFLKQTLVFICRADYWKSQARKYCDFCKCWIADNKPSVDFHEKGRRHQDNVAKRLKFITKKSRRDEDQSVRMDAALAQMEAAALEAYHKDIENNADLTSMAINKGLDAACSSESKFQWKEAKSDKGATYYWNTNTNETVWEAPKEGYLKLSEQDDHYKKKLKEYYKKQLLQSNLSKQESDKDKEEQRAAAEREKLKERRVEEIAPVITAPLIEESDNAPYGKWKTVQIIECEPEPEPLEEGEEEIVPEPEPEPVKFKEKTIESLGGSSTVFKKRKFGAASKRNCRSRLDTD